MLTDFGASAGAALAHGPGSFAEDVFLLGCALCFAATGRAPWPGRVGLARLGRAAVPAAATSTLAYCPAELTRIVLACLAPDPARRAVRPTACSIGLAGRRGRASAASARWLPDAVHRAAPRLPGAATAAGGVVASVPLESIGCEPC